MNELKKEVKLLDSWINEIEHGGWSSQNLDAMKKRRNELKAFLYDINN